MVQNWCHMIKHQFLKTNIGFENPELKNQINELKCIKNVIKISRYIHLSNLGFEEFCAKIYDYLHRKHIKENIEKE